MNTQNPFVITISRQVGSGGHSVGGVLAKKLDVRYCDKYLLETLEKKFNLSASSIERLKGEKKGWLAEMFSKVSPLPTLEALGYKTKYAEDFNPGVTTDDIFKAEVEILKGFAQMGSCVIAGRSGFFVFKNHPNRLNVLVTAPLEYRIRRVMSRQGLTEEEAEKLIRELDQARENYIQRYTGSSRFDARNYDLVINTEGHTEEEVADLILKYIG